MKLLIALIIAQFSFASPVPHIPTKPGVIAPEAALRISLNHGRIYIEGVNRSTFRILEWTIRDPKRVPIRKRQTLNRYEITSAINMTKEEFRNYTKRVHFKSDATIRMQVPKSANIQISNLHGVTVIRGMEGEFVKVEQMDGKLQVIGGTAPLLLHGVKSKVKVSGVDAVVYVTSESGKVSISDSKDGGVINTTTGDISLKEGVGTFELHSISGKISVEGLDGALHARSESGLIFANRMRGFTNVSSESGEVEIVLDPTHEPVPLSLTSNSGDIKLTIPKSLAAHLSANTSSGAIYSTLPIRKSEENRLQGRLRGGGARISISSRSGDISLFRQ